MRLSIGLFILAMRPVFGQTRVSHKATSRWLSAARQGHTSRVSSPGCAICDVPQQSDGALNILCGSASAEERPKRQIMWPASPYDDAHDRSEPGSIHTPFFLNPAELMDIYAFLKTWFQKDPEAIQSDSEQVMNEADQAEVASFEVPANTLGIHTLYEPEVPPSEVTVDVVAVHGLGGDSFSTWTDKSTGKLWLRDFLPHSTYFVNARVLSFGYDSRAFISPFANASTGRVFTFAEELLGALSDQRVRARGRPIILIGHSLGGIVIKSAMVYAQAKPHLYHDISASVKSIIFFGTPHQGANIAIWARYLEQISRAIGIKRANVTKELQTWSKPLVELTTLFSEQIPDLLITTFFETQPTYGVIVVDEGSARLGHRNEVPRPMNANHLSICKFANEDNPSYRSVLARLEATSDVIKTQASEEAALRSMPKSVGVLQQGVGTSSQSLEERLKKLGNK